MKKIILTLLLLFAIFFAGCSQVDLGKVDLSNVSEEDINKVIVCNPPYMRYAAECCLDTDNNSICDRDETAELEQEKKIDFAIIKNRNSTTTIKLTDIEKDLFINAFTIGSKEISKRFINTKIKDSHLNYIGNNENTVAEELIFLFEKKEYSKLKELNYEIFKNYSSDDANEFKKYELNQAFYIIHNNEYYLLYEDSYIKIENAEIKEITNNTIKTNSGEYIFQYSIWYGDSSNIEVKQSTQERIITDIEVVQIYAINTADGNIDNSDEIFVVIRLGSGSASINLNDLLIKFDTQIGSQTATYSSTSSTSTYNLSYISNKGIPNANGYISTGDLALISFVNENSIGQGQTATLRLLTKNGAVKPIDLTTPSTMTKETTYLYP